MASDEDCEYSCAEDLMRADLRSVEYDACLSRAEETATSLMTDLKSKMIEYIFALHTLSGETRRLGGFYRRQACVMLSDVGAVNMLTCLLGTDVHTALVMEVLADTIRDIDTFEQPDATRQVLRVLSDGVDTPFETVFEATRLLYYLVVQCPKNSMVALEHRGAQALVVHLQDASQRSQDACCTEIVFFTLGILEVLLDGSVPSSRRRSRDDYGLMDPTIFSSVVHVLTPYVAGESECLLAARVAWRYCTRFPHYVPSEEDASAIVAACATTANVTIAEYLLLTVNKMIDVRSIDDAKFMSDVFQMALAHLEQRRSDYLVDLATETLTLHVTRRASVPRAEAHLGASQAAALLRTCGAIGPLVDVLTAPPVIPDHTRPDADQHTPDMILSRRRRAQSALTRLCTAFPSEVVHVLVQKGAAAFERNDTYDDSDNDSDDSDDSETAKSPLFCTLRAAVEHALSTRLLLANDDVSKLRAVAADAEAMGLCKTVVQAKARLHEVAARHGRLAHLGVSTLLSQPPDEFRCPITCCTLEDPVVASDGHTYERRAIEKLMERTMVSPMTREELTPSVFPNVNIRKRMQQYESEMLRVAEAAFAEGSAAKRPRPAVA